MKIIYIHQYFKTPEEGGPMRSYYLSKALVDAGYEVEMISAHNQKEYKFAERDGLKIHYLPVFYNNSMGFFGRVISFLKFIYLAYQKAKNIPDADLCYASSTPLTVGVIALQLKRIKKIPYYFEVRDLWPEAPIQMGYIKNFFLKKLLYQIEKKIYKNAREIVALSPGMRDGIEAIVPEKNISIIPNMSDCDFFRKEPKDADLLEEFDIEGKFVVSYFGAIGKVNHLEYMIDLIQECQKHNLKNLIFLIVGQGSESEKIKKLVSNYNLENVRFLDYMNKYGLRRILNVTDATYVSFALKPILETNSPNKLFDAFAAGKLVIVNSKGWLKDIIEESACGFYADPENPGSFVTKIIPFINDKNLLMQYQNNSRKQAEQYFSREIQTEKFLNLFKKESKLENPTSSAYTLTA